MTTTEQAQGKTRVLIIGFGISGIAATHYFAAAGERFELTTVEASDTLGGVWEPKRHYPGFRANNTRNTFELPDLRHKEGQFDDFPTQAQVNAYLKDYVAAFDLAKHVHFNTRVESISRRREGEGPWLFDVSFSAAVAGSTAQTFDFVVVASGFTELAHVPPELASTREQFAAPLVHSCVLTATLAETPELCAGKRVAVIGGSKSAIDIAVWAASEGGAAQVDMITDTLHWSPPRYFGDNDPAKGKFNEEVLYSRFAEWFLPVCVKTVSPIDGPAPKMLTYFHETEEGRKLRDAFWAGVCADIQKQFGIPEELIPKHDFVFDAPYLAIQHPDFFPLIAAGKIRVELARASGFGPGQVQLSAGEPLDCDVVVCATGFKSSWTFLSEEMRAKLYTPDGQAQLFRNVYNPDLEQIAFIGAQLNTNWMMTAALAARWVVELAKGKQGALHRSGALKNTAAIREVIAAGLAFDREHAGANKGMYTTGSSIHPYVECMLGDMGSSEVRSRYQGFEDEIMGPLFASRYAGLATAEF